MTAITIWLNVENDQHPALWLAADSLVSNSSKQPLINDAAKVFGLPIMCRAPGPEGFYSELYFAHTLGYCFAGSTLMGQNAYLGLVPLMSNLISGARYIPSMEEIAQYVLEYLRLSFDDYKITAGTGAIFEVAIFGYCHRQSGLSVFHFHPELVDGVFQLVMTAHQRMAPNEFVYLGDRREEVCTEIRQAFEGTGAPGRPASRAPRYVIQNHIERDDSPTIGGDLQLALADEFGFRPLALCKPRVHGQPEAYFSYLGRELNQDMAQVGEARIGMASMT